MHLNAVFLIHLAFFSALECVRSGPLSSVFGLDVVWGREGWTVHSSSIFQGAVFNMPKCSETRVGCIGQRVYMGGLSPTVRLSPPESATGLRD